MFTPHFTLHELLRSDSEQRQKSNLQNVSYTDIQNLHRLCTDILEPVRTEFGYPITINSGYRSPFTNGQVGGAANSLHLSGCAVDFTIKERASLFAMYDYIRTHFEYAELILYKDRNYDSRFIHVACDYSPKLFDAPQRKMAKVVVR
ncbi:peptidase [Dipodfec virus UOA04_Rod_575]|nr:peptidase [Dipodfec virus UOA04_Rod_575]